LKLGDQFISKIQPKLASAMTAGSESVAKDVNANVDKIVNNGQKYNQAKYKNTYSPDHAKVRKQVKYQTGYVDLQMQRKDCYTAQCKQSK